MTKLLRILTKNNILQTTGVLKNLLLGTAVMLLALYLSYNWFQLMLIQGDSMMPSYHNMQLVILDKRQDTYQQGDVIAFWCEGLSAVLVKRVAAVPGETVVIQDGTLFVNQKESDFYDCGAFLSPGILHEAQSLSAGEYIVIGDNLEMSKDSRDACVGFVHSDDIIGRVLN